MELSMSKSVPADGRGKKTLNLRNNKDFLEDWVGITSIRRKARKWGWA